MELGWLEKTVGGGGIEAAQNKDVQESVGWLVTRGHGGEGRKWSVNFLFKCGFKKAVGVVVESGI